MNDGAALCKRCGELIDDQYEYCFPCGKAIGPITRDLFGDPPQQRRDPFWDDFRPDGELL